MGVSIGFHRKINDWILSQEQEVVFRPFLVDGNPYKSRVFVVGAFPQPKLDIQLDEQQQYIESLVNESLFDRLYGEKMQSRENKGVATFTQWLKEACGEVVVNTNVTTLMADSVKQLKALKKTTLQDYEKGFQVFREVLEEFQPEIVILHGADALKQFRHQFEHCLIDYYAHIEKVQELEEVGTFAEIHFHEERKVKILACRNLSMYGKSGEKFANFKKHVLQQLS
ncbi:MAG: hypothetical protein ACI33M_06735 [Lysinibacillus sp.]